MRIRKVYIDTFECKLFFTMLTLYEERNNESLEDGIARFKI